jgi:hypothetical protein
VQSLPEARTHKPDHSRVLLSTTATAGRHLRKS